MGLDIDSIIDAAASHAAETGYFDAVNGHEPKNAPGRGLAGSIWFDTLRAIPSSGLASASALLVLNFRMYTSMLQEPQDAVDPMMVRALSALFEGYAGDFTLGGLVRDVDLLGANGTALQAKAGYLKQDEKEYRIITITLPIVVNDVWDEEA